MGVALYNLPHAGFAITYADAEKRKELNVKSSQNFIQKLAEAQHFVNHNMLVIPKEIAEATNKLLQTAHYEAMQAMLYPDPFERNVMVDSKEFFTTRSENIKKFQTDGDKLQDQMRLYLAGKGQ